ncbi:MAG: peptidase dimerization domain-containing protein [Burkholderiales bacterium]|nr:peptidase dimerization domain-containing protein [Burkholderiales bacterium]
MEITVRGRQAHGGMPWHGIDAIVVASQVGARPADNRQPPNRHHARAGRGDNRFDQGRHAGEYRR